MRGRAQGPSLRVVVLKRDRLYGELLAREVRKEWKHADVEVFQLGLPALESIQASVPDLFFTGTRIDDMDGLEHLEPFVETVLPILIITGQTDDRTFAMLQELRLDGLYDAPTEGTSHLPDAFRAVVDRRSYVSPAFLPFLKRPRRVTLDVLTRTEEAVLSVIGDGSDDSTASERLNISQSTVHSHRKSIMRKLGIHHKGELVRVAGQRGYVLLSSESVRRPGFQRRLNALKSPKGGACDRTT